MSASFDRWLEYSLQNELAPAYEVDAVPAHARYRHSMPGRRRVPRTIGRIALAAALTGVLGTVGVEAAGYGPVHIGTTGVYVKIGTPATPNPPVIPPSASPAQIGQPKPQLVTSPKQEDDSSTRTNPIPTSSARASESPEHEDSYSSSPRPSTSAWPSGSPAPSDH